MSRASRSFMWTAGIAAAIAGFSCGCAHMIESRAITAFANSLESNDLDRMKKISSDEFGDKALRRSDAMDDLKLLNLPTGKHKVVDVEDLADGKKRVTVHVGERKKDSYFELVRDDSGKWVVDDIYMKQKRKGIEAYKSVTEQMNLFETVREFFDAWAKGDREQVLAVTSPKLRAVLVELPPSYLAYLTHQVTQGRPKNGKFNPQAAIDEKIAVVRLPRSSASGQTVLTMELRKGKWQVANIGIDSRDEEEKIPSIIDLAQAVNRCLSFLAAYEIEDKNKLTDLCAEEFFKGCLSLADLKQVKLPESQLPDHEMKVQLRGNRADFTLRNGTEFVQIDMRRAADKTLDGPGAFQVSDVTIYEIASKQEKRLSALFTAQGMLEVFIDALARRELDQVKHCSTQDFSSRVWSKINEATVSSMPLEDFDSKEYEIVAASFLGALTKIDVRQGDSTFTYMLTDEGGRFMVDDVQWHKSGVPSSVKSTLEVMIPIQDFASGITLGRDAEQQEKALDLIQGNSTNEFNKLVWDQTRVVPSSGMSADTFLQAPLHSMAIGENDAIVQLGSPKYGAKVMLRREHNRFIVDDVLLIAGALDTDRLAMRQTLRTQLARGEARGPKTIVQAGFESEARDQVEQAVYQTTEDGELPRKSDVAAPRELDKDHLDPFAEEISIEPASR